MKIQNFAIFVKKSLKINILKTKKYCNVREHCHYTGKCRGAVYSIRNLKYSVSKAVPIVFHNVSYYYYHLIIKQLAEEFEAKFNCLGENTEKYVTFSIPIVKQVKRIDKNGEEIIKAISFRLQFIDSAKFMLSSLSNLIDYLSEGIHKI